MLSKNTARQLTDLLSKFLQEQENQLDENQLGLLNRIPMDEKEREQMERLLNSRTMVKSGSSNDSKIKASISLI